MLKTAELINTPHLLLTVQVVPPESVRQSSFLQTLNTSYHSTDQSDLTDVNLRADIIKTALNNADDAACTIMDAQEVDIDADDTILMNSAAIERLVIACTNTANNVWLCSLYSNGRRLYCISSKLHFWLKF
jgi:hypothetical protein